MVSFIYAKVSQEKISRSSARCPPLLPHEKILVIHERIRKYIHFCDNCYNIPRMKDVWDSHNALVKKQNKSSTQQENKPRGVAVRTFVMIALWLFAKIYRYNVSVMDSSDINVINRLAVYDSSIKTSI